MDYQNARITIRDVAQVAGVSTGTVSRVLNNRTGVKEKTRDAVLEAIARLNYRPDQAARELSFRQATRIGLSVSPDSRRFSPFFILFLENLMNELQIDGYRVEEIATGPDGLPETLSDGMVLFDVHDNDPRVSYLHEKAVPFVLIGHHPGSRWVAPDDIEGGYKATRHLIELGHRDIIHVGGQLQGQVACDRYSGYHKALEEAGITIKEEHFLDGDFSSLDAYRVVRKALENGLRFSAVFAVSDETAIGTISALEDMNLHVPNDVSVIGFDDLPEIGSHLTTIRQDISLIARTAVTLLKEGLRGEPIRHEIVPVQLVDRGTTIHRR